MNVLQLRIMTRKSIIGFGWSDVKDLTVQQALDLQKNKFLVKAYFGLDRISFQDDILEELGISKEMRLKKPSKLPIGKRSQAVFDAMTNFYKRKGFTEFDHLKQKIRQNRVNKAININKTASRSRTKRQLQAKNQGNFRE